MKKFFLAILPLVCLFIASCDSAGSNATKPSANGEVKKGVAPIADPEIAVIEMENSAAYGTIKIELYSNIAPKHVARFKELAKEGYYSGISFHRINQTVIQAGDSNTKPGAAGGKVEGDSGKPHVQAEFSDIPYDTGILGAARFGNDVNSANSQFFIMLKREAAFDNKYTVYGKVIEGMNNVRTIAQAPKQEGTERPVEPIRIKSVTIVPR